MSKTRSQRAVKWSTDGTVEDISPYVPTPEVGNDAGVISGWGTSGHGYRLDPNGTLADLGKTAYVISVSPGGFVVGSFYISAWATTAVRWALDGTPTTLPSLPTHNNSSAREMNAGGTVVGFTSRTEQMNYVETNAVKWSPDGTITALANLPGSKDSEAHLINSAGTIAGSAGDSAKNSHTVVWRSWNRSRALQVGVPEQRVGGSG
ncbi:hypothetical protein AB0I60_27360 [Actinosynnema sp. NPDC050436]|uniref:hypothetical protein n=1 Tax=Actinosynnema sp. NPDC050436 TaxID=3155659 RepID=UPI0033F784ED